MLSEILITLLNKKAVRGALISAGAVGTLFFASQTLSEGAGVGIMLIILAVSLIYTAYRLYNGLDHVLQDIRDALIAARTRQEQRDVPDPEPRTA